MKNPIITYYESGEPWIKEWYLNDQLHRIDGPASIVYYLSGKVRFIEWWRNSKRHRTDGPAYIGRYETGEIYDCEWFLNGEEIYPEEWLEEKGYEWPLNKQQEIEFLLTFG